MKKIVRILLLTLAGGTPLFTGAADQSRLTSPDLGVVCDAYFCADASGISDALTAQYLGEKKGKQLVGQGEFNRTSFTFANGIHCDTQEKVCRKDRYFGVDGKPSGAVDTVTTQRLFGR